MHRVVDVQLVARTRAKAMATLRQPFAEEARPRVAQLFVGPYVRRDGVLARAQVLVLQAGGQRYVLCDADARLRAQLVGWCRLRIVVVDADHCRLGTSEEPRRSGDAAEFPERAVDLVV